MAPSHPDLTTFKALSFDCYGTLIDWETGILTALTPLTSHLAPSHPYNETPPTKALRRLDELATAHQQRTPTLPYNELLVMSLSDLAHELHIPLPDSISEPFGNSVGTWRAFSDTVSGLQKLARHYKLIILSNVDNANMSNTLDKQLGSVKFDAVYTAQDIGCYKPMRTNFQYLVSHARRDLEIDWHKGELLHVACSLPFDVVPARDMGLRCVWIARRSRLDPTSGGRDAAGAEWRFGSIGEFADEVERQFAEKEKA